MFEWIDKLFNKHKFVRRFLVMWASITIAWTTYMMFRDITLISTAASMAYATNTALLATVIGLYQWSRNKEAPYVDDNSV